MNILLTSVGRRSYLVNYFKEALGDKGQVHAANSSSLSPAFLCADKTVVTPIIYSDEYIPFLKKYCMDNNINAIISLFDVDLPVLSEHREEFKELGVNVIVADKDKVDICNDKWKTYLFLKENKFDAPITFLNVEDALKAIDSGELDFPVMVKPRWGMGSLAVYEAENKEELKVFYQKSYRNIMKSYLKYEAEQDDKACVLIQEKIAGQEYGMDVMNDLEGNYRHAAVKMKYAMRSGETDCAITVDNKEIREIGVRLSSLLKHRGNLDVDILMRGDTPCVLEMNARFGGGYPFSHMAGVNLPQAIVNWLTGEDVPDSLLEEEVGVSAHKDIALVKMNLDNV